ncbi:MAG: hypothetical protein RL708_669 [Bacteroidota bacterium]|jgi:two-component system phosphate regulon sensor histidine kinase PhoR
MKLKKAYIFLITLSIALLIILFIQVNWIVEAAKIKEELFSEKVDTILSKTATDLRSDTFAIHHLPLKIGINEKRKIDSLLHHYMKMYNIKLDYNFSVNEQEKRNNNQLSFLNLQQSNYKTCLNDDGKNELILNLNFPDKKAFLLAEMRMPFMISVVLIFVVLVISWLTILAVIKEQKIAAQTKDFLNNMTHEFKTPITNIALAGKMIAKDFAIEQNEKLKNYTEIIINENGKLKQQVEQLLGFTELERGEIPLQKNDFNFHELIENAATRMQLQLQNKNGKLELKLNATNFFINGDAIHLNNTICNFIDNAIKYSDKNPIIKIETCNQNNYLTIKITDNGIGIEKSFHDKVFEKYFRVPTGNLHNVKGFGLGLAYCKMIIKQHDGTVNLKSEINKGTTFIISLPHA